MTINRATEKEDGVTRIGNHNFLMANSHVAHDCKLGNHIIIANGSLLGGHVHVHDHASLSGGVAVHHYGTVGSYCFIAGISRVIARRAAVHAGRRLPARPRCINIVALKRNNFAGAEIDALAEAHRLLYRSKVGLQATTEMLRSKNQIFPGVELLLDFIERQQVGRHGRGREHKRAA